MKIFKLIEIDLEKERKRINFANYNKRQRNTLYKLVDLFEAGEWQKCLDFINNKKNFPYNKEGYDEKEHIGMAIGDILHDVAHYNYWTRDALLKEAKEVLEKENKGK